MRKTASQLQHEINTALKKSGRRSGTSHSTKLPRASRGLRQAGELEDSFPSESSAWKFGEYLKGRLGTDYSVYPLVSTGGGTTAWYRLAITPRHLKRAEDLRDAWRSALNLTGKSEASL